MNKTKIKSKKLFINLTSKQVYQIRDFTAKNGYPENSGKNFYLLAQPYVRDFDNRLDILLISEKNGDKLRTIFKKFGLVKS